MFPLERHAYSTLANMAWEKEDLEFEYFFVKISSSGDGFKGRLTKLVPYSNETSILPLLSCGCLTLSYSLAVSPDLAVFKPCFL